jgi:hypothetical protein
MHHAYYIGYTLTNVYNLDEDRPAEWDTPTNLIHQQHSNFRAICERFDDIELLKAMALNRLKKSK